MEDPETARRSRIDEALAAQLELLSGGVSGASTYRVHGLTRPCVLKVIDADSADHLRTRGHREIRFYDELAPRIPLRTPRVLASLIEASGRCALLLAAYTPVKPGSGMNAAEFTEIAEQLGRFHAAYWNRTDQLDTLPWVEKLQTPDLTDAARHAYKTWRTLAQRPQLRNVLTDATLGDIEAALAELVTRPEHAPGTAMTLCHGDCHLGNLLRDRNGRLVWADWQEVRVGHGPSDLTFLLQRAEAEGANVAHDLVVAAYCSALRAAGVGGADECAVTSAMNESERRTRLLYWPDYLSDAKPGRMAHHLTRIFST